MKVYLPRIDQPVSVDPESSRKKLTRGSETILLVEDDEMVRTLVRETLQREGYKILDAPGPLEAKRIAEQFRPAIQLMITDVVMPKMSGRELAEQLSRKRPEMKVLYMSGYTDNAVLNSGILEKEVAFLQKPFTPAALTEKSPRSARNRETDPLGQRIAQARFPAQELATDWSRAADNRACR